MMVLVIRVCMSAIGRYGIVLRVGFRDGVVLVAVAATRRLWGKNPWEAVRSTVL